MRIILKQLISSQDEIPEELKTLYKSSIRESSEPGIKKLISALESCSRRFSSKYAVFDALDECSDTYKRDILDLFVNLQNVGYKLLISGRLLLEVSRLINVSTLEISPTGDDVERFIIKRLDERHARPKIRTKCLELIGGTGGM